MNLLFTNQDENVIAGIQNCRIEIWTWGQNFKMIDKKFCRDNIKHKLTSNVEIMIIVNYQWNE